MKIAGKCQTQNNGWLSWTWILAAAVYYLKKYVVFGEHTQVGP